MNLIFDNFTESKCNIYGQTGFEIDFKNSTIRPHNAPVRKLVFADMDIVRSVIDFNINYINEQIASITEIMNLTEPKQVPIKDGFRIINVPGRVRKELMQNRLEGYSDTLDFLKVVNYKEICK